ncbi:hypothetical protein P43SY_003757 [Pythium insidiosum]|uniref:Uncharacterized protein n=1 Tax=Pythium insidiosum TaxID=114742 RepID=A0AAD5LD07_PYTIN|nr:hypothetical protein P43SY_003757 [Pythium insidiosum]
MSSSSRVPLLVGGNKGRKPTRLPIAPRARPANVERAKRAPGAADDADATATTDAMTLGDEATPKPAAEPHRSPERAALPAVLPVAVAAPSVPAIQLPPPVSTPSPRPGGISPGSAIAVSLRRTAKKVGSYRDPSDSMDDPDGDDDADYEQTRDDDDDLDLPETDNPQIFMPARERATLWAKKVLEQSDDPNALALVPKKERTKRKRSNSAKRKELKSKFKYEEKHHPTLIEIALKASTAPLDSEIVDVISRMAEKDAQKKEAKRRSQSEDLGDGLQSPSTVSSSAVPTPPPVQEEFAEDRYGGYFRERKDSYDFSN